MTPRIHCHDRPLDVQEHLGLTLHVARDLERVIAALDDVQRRGLVERRQNWLQLRGRPECIAASLHEQHRATYRRQVRIAAILVAAGRVQRIAEEHDPASGSGPAVGRDVRGNPAAHRLAADEHGAAALGLHGLDHRGVARLERRPPIGNAPALLGIEEIERDHVDAKLREGGGERGHEAAVLSGARAVREDQRGIHARLGRFVHARRHGRVAVEGDRQLSTPDHVGSASRRRS